MLRRPLPLSGEGHSTENAMNVRKGIIMLVLALASTASAAETGVVKVFNDAKGFGFITPDGGGPDIFVHVSGLKDQIRENDHVTFDVQNGKKGLNAVNVRKS